MGEWRWRHKEPIVVVPFSSLSTFTIASPHPPYVRSRLISNICCIVGRRGGQARWIYQGEEKAIRASHPVALALAFNELMILEWILNLYSFHLNEIPIIFGPTKNLLTVKKDEELSRSSPSL